MGGSISQHEQKTQTLHKMSPAQSRGGVPPGCPSELQTFAALPPVSQKTAQVLLPQAQGGNSRTAENLQRRPCGNTTELATTTSHDAPRLRATLRRRTPDKVAEIPPHFQSQAGGANQEEGVKAHAQGKAFTDPIQPAEIESRRVSYCRPHKPIQQDSRFAPALSALAAGGRPRSGAAQSVTSAR